ncbi:MAG: 2-oxoacid ferredoxin oxidoreductase [Firmicutes bacterium]|nr:2-oxoacid ferredoxin oxidoreductase [Bacillota bacterium]
MRDIKEYAGGTPAWCPGCGDFAILDAVKQALAEMDISPSRAVVVSGIGQAGKLPHYMRVNTLNTLHGRTLPTATAVTQVNPQLTVFAVGGDGDGYGEGGNHFLHALRRNPDMTYIVCDNRVFGLTKGQASPTSDVGTLGGLTPQGTVYPALNPLALAIMLEAGSVARGFSGAKEHLVNLIKDAVRTPGFSLIDVLQPCVSFNKVNTWQWYRERVYELEADYNPTDQQQALALARQWDEQIPIGVLYRSGRESSIAPENLVSAELRPNLEPLLDRYRV